MLRRRGAGMAVHQFRVPHRGMRGCDVVAHDLLRRGDLPGVHVGRAATPLSPGVLNAPSSASASRTMKRSSWHRSGRASLNGSRQLNSSARTAAVAAARPRSGRTTSRGGTPVLWNCWSLKSGPLCPLWQGLHSGQEPAVPAPAASRPLVLPALIRSTSMPRDVGQRTRRWRHEVAAVRSHD